MQEVEMIEKVVSYLQKETKKFRKPSVSKVKEVYKDPYKILISTILSLRTKDGVTEKASFRLFSLAKDPYEMVNLKDEEIEKAIYPVGFYRNKARVIKDISRKLISEYRGVVPDTLSELLRLKGVGRKTANLVLILGFGKDGICVDTHVHRIFNRIGYINTKTPHETEVALREKLPKRYWRMINDLLVTFGKNICVPVSPFCSKCGIEGLCKKVGVSKSR